MKPSLAAGVTRTERVAVDEARTIAFLGETLRVYSTPSMVNDVEYACFRLIGEHLDEGESSVGAHVSLDHLDATPLGETVTVTVTVSGVEGRRVALDAEVRDAAGLVGRGRHVRVVIDLARHGERIAARRAKLAQGR